MSVKGENYNSYIVKLVIFSTANNKFVYGEIFCDWEVKLQQV